MDLDLTSEPGEDGTAKTVKKDSGQSLKDLLGREAKFLDSCREVKVIIIITVYMSRKQGRQFSHISL